MSLFNKAYETYEYHKSLVGMLAAGKSPLLPISHILKNVQIEVSINLNGEFVSAKAKILMCLLSSQLLFL